MQEFLFSVGLKQSSYYSLQQAGNLPRADEALAIAQALGVTVEYLVTGKEADPAAPYLDALKSIKDIANKALP